MNMTPFVIVTLVLFGVTSLAVLWTLAGMYPIDWEDRDGTRRRMRRMLIAMGCWQVSVGLVLIAEGMWGSSIGVIGIGIIIGVAAWRNVFTGLR